MKEKTGEWGEKGRRMPADRPFGRDLVGRDHRRRHAIGFSVPLTRKLVPYLNMLAKLGSA